MLRFMELINCLPEFEYFTVFLKNRNLFQKLPDQKLQTMANPKHIVYVVMLRPCIALRGVACFDISCTPDMCI